VVQQLCLRLRGHGQHQHLLLLELAPKFPEERPLLTLQIVRHSAPEGLLLLRGCPWSPR
jgi:hypothetical protein